MLTSGLQAGNTASLSAALLQHQILAGGLQGSMLSQQPQPVQAPPRNGISNRAYLGYLTLLGSNTEDNK